MTEVPEFDQFVEYVTSGGILPVALEQHSLGELPTLETVRDGYARVAALGRPAILDAGQVAALQEAIAEVYHQDVAEHEVGADPAQTVERLLWVRSRPEWHVGLQCVTADAERTVGVYFNLADGNLYRCITPHVAQADWRPDLPGVAALWARFYEPEAGPQPWEQPLGAGYGYLKGAKVTHNGFVWESIFDGENVWEPGVFGWEQVGPV